MPTGQLIAFAVWLVLALLAGALLVLVWERLRITLSAAGASAQEPAEAAGRSGDMPKR